jgi:hypothetical protein
LLPPSLEPVWLVPLIPELAEEVELDADELDADELGVDELGVAAAVAVLPDGVVVVDVVVELVPVDASAVPATPEMRPTVIAAAETAAPAAASRPRSRRRFGVSLGFMPLTMLRRGSGPRHHRVKTASSLAGTP